jgi:serine/threonine protein kinase/tetratricopeptide (TPR) repeat protein
VSEETLWRQVLEQPPAERAAFLERACGGDAELRTRLEALLHAGDDATTIRRAPADGEPHVTDAFPPTLVPLPPSSRIGPYHLRDKLGEGGMGTVWLAEQHEPVHRRVALKVMKAGIATPHALARFEQERQALALMDHPHIARVLDAGTTAAGQPYFVMELVQGVPINKYCDDHRLTPRERLELFLPVCQAVQHAHQKGIIHRDLKPSNILVAEYDGKPAPKVIDFGVAKATSQRLTQYTQFTEVGQAIGTLEYMAPEQVELDNLDIDTRADIYALGVVLYELLTGTPPFTVEQLRAGSLSDMLRLIREVEPPRPSTRLAGSGELAALADRRRLPPRKLTTVVRGELDWIAMKCLEKDRTRRYETASGLALDVQRYLADEPVLAGPPSTAYRLRKFLRRHRVPVLAGAALVLALVAGIVGTTWGLVRALDAEADATGQRDRAEGAERATKKQLKRAIQAEADRTRERDRALAAEKATRDESERRLAAEQQERLTLDAFTSDVVLSLLAQRAEKLGPRERQFLTRILQFYERSTQAKGEDRAAREQRALGYYRVAFIRDKLGETTEAEAAYRVALKLFEQLASESADGSYRLYLARLHTNLAVVFGQRGQLGQAEAQSRRALELYGQLAATAPDVFEHRLEFARAHCNLATTLLERERAAESEPLLREALELLTRLSADFPRETPVRHQLQAAHLALGSALAAQGRSAAAEKEMQLALDHAERLVADFPDAADFRKGLGTTRLVFANLLFALPGRQADAERQYGLALEGQKQLCADYPRVPVYRQEMAQMHNNLGVLLQNQGRAGAAVEEFRLALQLRTNLAAEFATVAVYRQELARIHLNLGVSLAALGRSDEAEEHLRLAVALQTQLLAEHPGTPAFRHDLSASQAALGNLLQGQGKYAAAAEPYQAALELRAKLAAEFPKVISYQLGLGASAGNLGELKLKLGQLAAALELYDQSVAVLQKANDVVPQQAAPRLRLAYRGRALTLDALQRHAEAARDWALVLQLTPAAQQAADRLAYAFSLARSGAHASAAQEGAVLAALPQGSGKLLYDLARVYALCAAAADKADLRETYGARAVELLRQTGAVGLRREGDLHALRRREDYRQLVGQ